MKRALLISLFALASLSCSSDDGAEATAPAGTDAATRGDAGDGAEDTMSTGDGGGTDASDLDTSEIPDGDGTPDGGVDTTAPPVDPPATEYCERAAEVFCPYYLRCGRMAVDTEAACLEAFVPACNSRFEPIYAELANRGRLRLSGAGLAECAGHLETVSCDAQIFDLDLGCSNVWQGLAAIGEPCGPGIESFVCAAGSTCVLGLDFCGTCEPTVPVGSACGGGTGRCEPTASCQDGVCVARPIGGESCVPDGIPCVTGTSCVASANGDVCTGRSWSAPGESCGQTAQCQYKSQCIGGVCEETSLIGGSCSQTLPCAAGYCTADGDCAAMQSFGEPCSTAAQCDTGRCEAGSCAAVVTSCLE